MKDRFEIFNQLGVVPRGLLINSINLNIMTQKLIVDLLYDPEQKLPFRLVLENCRKVSWEMMQDNEEFIVADVIGFHLGEDNYELPTVIATDVFVITIEYEKSSLEKYWS